MLAWLIACGGPAPETDPPNEAPPDTVSKPTPEAPICGDGTVDDGEACDDGPANADDAVCTSTCALAACGDGLVQVGVETCDDGADNADDAGCTSACLVAACGDGFVFEGVETCDDGGVFGGDGCAPDCVAPVLASLADAAVILVGERPGDGLGQSILHVGDLSGDGIDDFVVAAAYTDDNTGTIYVFHGPIAAGLGIDDADAVLTGRAPGDLAGYLVAAGDLNDDGINDLAFGGFYPANGAPSGDVMFGPIVGDRSLADADVHVLQDQGIPGSIAIADLTGDGVDDLVVGDWRNNGDTYIRILAGPFAAGSVDLADAEALLYGGHTTGPFATADTNGDGLMDLVVACTEDEQGGDAAGAVYLVLGPIVGEQSLTQTAAAKVVGRPDQYLGQTMSAGDMDGDGLADLALGAWRYDGVARDAGIVYLFHSPVAAGTIDVASADTLMFGVEAGDGSGGSVDFGGDLNADGVADLLISAAAHSLPNGEDFQGGVQVVFGPIEVGVELDLADAELTLWGEEADEYAGTQIALVGDVNGDGYGDFATAAWNSDQGGSDAGVAYVVFGPRP